MSALEENVSQSLLRRETMEDQDDFLPQDEQAIRNRIDDEIVNRDLMERLNAPSVGR